MPKGKGSYKVIDAEMPLLDALDAATDVEGLAEEMRSWTENEEGTPAEGTNRHQLVEEAADTLEAQGQDLTSCVSRLRDLIGPFVPADAKVKFREEVLRTKRRYGPSRAIRLANATTSVSAALDAIELLIASVEEEKKTEIDSLLGEARDSIDELEAVEFPGMYGG